MRGVCLCLTGGNNMYAKVNSPKRRVTEKWLDQAFAPLKDYLKREYPDEKDQIMGYLMFMGNEDEKFHYKNSITRGYIVFDQAGQVISSCDSALEYQFEGMFGSRGEYKSLQERYLHPKVTRWIEQSLKGDAVAKYGLEVGVFLQELWGPVVNYDFSDLKIGYPLRRTRTPYCLFIYPSEFQSLMAFQFVGDEIVERKCSLKQYSNYISRERDLTVKGWQTLTFIHELLEYDNTLNRQYLMNAIEIADLRDPVYELTPAARKFFAD
jgi:hypothetical protein